MCNFLQGNKKQWEGIAVFVIAGADIITGKFIIAGEREIVYFCRNFSSGSMLQARNDTILKQLHQAVNVNLSDSIHVTRQLITPQELHIPPGKANDSLNRDFYPVLQKQISLEQLISDDERDLVPIPPIQPEKVTLLTEQHYQPQIILPERKIERNSPDWQMGIFILSLILLGSVRLFFNKYLGQLLSSTVNYVTASRMFRERSVSLVHASFRLDIMFYIVAGLFIYHTVDVFGARLPQPGIIAYLILVGGVLGYFSLKKLIYYLQGNIFRATPETLEFLFNMNMYNRVTGLFLLPVSLIVAFTPLSKPELVIYAGLFIIFIFYILLILRGVKILMKKHFSIFYLILYLCTLEILPLLYIYKLVLG